MTCSFASQNGHLNCLKYAHEHGCEWNERIFLCISKNKYPDCFQYAIKEKCPGYEKYQL